MIRRMRPILFAAVATAAVLIARPALAGPPLLCFPYDIGHARSLPMGQGSWQAIDPKYDVSHLVDDTLAILVPAAPLPLRMETLRRAVVYASPHPTLAAALLAALQDRANARRDLAAFDQGYAIDAFREAEPIFKQTLTTDR